MKNKKCQNHLKPIGVVLFIFQLLIQLSYNLKFRFSNENVHTAKAIDHFLNEDYENSQHYKVHIK